jgi:hypothetical protein
MNNMNPESEVSHEVQVSFKKQKKPMHLIQHQKTVQY